MALGVWDVVGRGRGATELKWILLYLLNPTQIWKGHNGLVFVFILFF